MYRLASLLAGAAASLSVSTALAQAAEPAAEPSFTRAEVQKTIADFRKVVAPNGVEEQLVVPLGGTRQAITVRGHDRANPILLFIHGGPASPDMGMSWAFQDGWEDYFTVVEWDQRGAGKTFGLNDPAVVAPTMTLDRITEDAAELIGYLKQRYGKRKVIVLGHSWGSIVGANLAHRHPELMYAYVGMGQVVGGVANETENYRQTLEQARARHNDEAVKELEALAPYPNTDGTLPLAKVGTDRKWSMAFGALAYNRTGYDYYENLAKLSPDYSWQDVKDLDAGSAFTLPKLLPEMMKFDFTRTTDFQVPIILFEGRHDFTTPSNVAEEWLSRVKAPKTKLVWFDNSSHMMLVEEPGKMLLHLVQDVRPIAVAAGDGAPSN